jgi:type IV pilus assembly protein PilE
MDHRLVLRSNTPDMIWSRSPSAAAAVLGFTLIELMVAVAIVAILTAIAYPSYLSQMKKSRRAAAESTLMDIAQREQQYLLDARSYAPDVPTLKVTIPSDVSSFYTVQICQSAAPPCTAPGGSPPAFAAVATPLSGTPQAGDVTLSIDNAGVKTPAKVW